MQWRQRSIDNARTLRRRSTRAEAKLWARLRNRALAGRKFRRQYALGRYVADLVCLEARLIIEIDGGQHALPAPADQRRTEWLARQGYLVIRFWNHEVVSNPKGVLEVIGEALQGPLTLPLTRAPPSPASGRGTKRRRITLPRPRERV
jgi:very-short-patch-repair endonuclease